MIYTLLALAIAPGIAISVFVYYMDKHEKEPLWLLATCFAYGLLSAGLTLIISVPVNYLVPDIEHSLIGPLLNAFIEVSFVEELSKFLFLIFLVYNRKDLNEPFDAILYSIMIGMGFATIENILYSLQYGYSVAVARMFSSVPAHAVFAVLMGYFTGLAKFKFKSKYFALVGLAVAIIFHGLYDYFIFISHIKGMIIGSFVALGLGVFLSLKAMRMHSNASPFKN